MKYRGILRKNVALFRIQPKQVCVCVTSSVAREGAPNKKDIFHSYNFFCRPITRFRFMLNHPGR